MGKIEFDLQEWGDEFGHVDLGTEWHIYDRDNPRAFVQSDVTMEVRP